GRAPVRKRRRSRVRSSSTARLELMPERAVSASIVPRQPKSSSWPGRYPGHPSFCAHTLQSKHQRLFRDGWPPQRGGHDEVREFAGGEEHCYFACCRFKSDRVHHLWACSSTVEQHSLDRSPVKPSQSRGEDVCYFAWNEEVVGSNPTGCIMRP